MPANPEIIAVSGAKSVKKIWIRHFDSVCLFNSASNFSSPRYNPLDITPWLNTGVVLYPTIIR